MKRSDLEHKFIADDRKERLAVVSALMGHRGGRKFLWWLLQVGKAVGHNPFTNNALTTSFGCGEMQVGQQILAELIEADPELFPTLMKENFNEQSARTEQLAGARPDD